MLCLKLQTGSRQQLSPIETDRLLSGADPGGHGAMIPKLLTKKVKDDVQFFEVW